MTPEERASVIMECVAAVESVPFVFPHLIADASIALRKLLPADNPERPVRVRVSDP